MAEKARKEIGKVKGIYQNMIDRLNKAAEQLEKKETDNENKIEELKHENAVVGRDIEEAYQMKAKLEEMV